MSKNKEFERAGAGNLTFTTLVQSIHTVNQDLSVQASRAVNISLTLRNWLIGCSIAEYELSGADRTRYGDKLLDTLAKELSDLQISNCNRRQLYRYLRFYRLYPEIVGTLPPQFKKWLPTSSSIAEKVNSLSSKWHVSPEKLVHQLSYSHLELIVDLDDELKRSFYVVECLQGNWSVRELKRQITSLYFERYALSHNQTKLAYLTQTAAEQEKPHLTIRDPYI